MITIILSSRVLLNDDVDDMATHYANTRGRAATGWCCLGLDDDDGYGSDVCGGLCVWVGLRDTNPVVDGIPILYIHSVSHVLFPYSSFASGCRARFNRSAAQTENAGIYNKIVSASSSCCMYVVGLRFGFAQHIINDDVVDNYTIRYDDDDDDVRRV